MTDRADPPPPDDPSTDSKEGATPPPAGSTGSAETPSPQAAAGEPGAGSLPSAPVPAAPPAWRPSYVHLAVVSIVSLALDLGTKNWAKARLDLANGGHSMDVIHDHLRFAFARNPGGAFGLLQEEPESIRRPFFLGISVLAVAFIVSLYRKLTPQQWALKWGLPLVLGGALGNLIDRIQDRHVVDFIDFRADWVRSMYSIFSKYPQDHWPTFNIADIAIVAGVGLMAIDMFTPRKPTLTKVVGPAAPPSDGEASSPPGATADAPKVGSEPAAKET